MKLQFFAIKQRLSYNRILDNPLKTSDVGGNDLLILREDKSASPS